MSDDRWIRELAKVNREQQGEERDQLDERWDRLTSGELSLEEEAELRALAETSEEAREAWEAFRPLGPDFQAGVVKAIAAEMASGAPESEPREAPPRLLPFRGVAPKTKAWLGAAAALAAALFLFLRVPASLPPMPVYTAELKGGAQALRGSEPDPASALPVFAPGDRFRVDLRPTAPVPKAKRLEARGVLSCGQDLRAMEVQSELVPSGSVKMEGSIGRDLRPGTCTLWAVVGRPGELPDPADLRRLSTKAPIRQRDWVAVPKKIQIQSRNLPP